MELLCTKCLHLTETEQCSNCGSLETRVPGDEDLCYLNTISLPRSTFFAIWLEQNGIPFRKQFLDMDKYGATYRFYVPYGRLDDIEAMREKYWKENHEMMNDDLVFSAEEIDGMDIDNLYNMGLEELEAYKVKINNTLKNIRLQEQKWRDRTNQLLEMRQEAENLIEDLS